MIREIVAAAVVLGSAANASAADWTYLTTTSNGIYFYDAASTSSAGSVVRVWLKLIWKKPVENPPAKPAGYKLSHWAINCSARAISVGQTSVYTSDNESIISLAGTPNNFEDIVPESAGDMLATAICRKHTGVSQ